jgi:hypothetical protein
MPSRSVSRDRRCPKKIDAMIHRSHAIRCFDDLAGPDGDRLGRHDHDDPTAIAGVRP